MCMVILIQDHMTLLSSHMIILSLSLSLEQLAYLLQGHKYGVTDCEFSPSGNLLASCSWDDTIVLWDVATGQIVQQLTGHESAVSSCSFGVGGSVLVRTQLICISIPPLSGDFLIKDM